MEIARSIHTDILARIAHAEKQYDKAIELYQQIINENPEASSVYRRLGSTYVENSEPLKAIDCYQKFITQNPKDALINYHLSMAYDAANKKNKAKKSMRKFLEMWKNADDDIPEIIKAKAFLKFGSHKDTKAQR